MLQLAARRFAAMLAIMAIVSLVLFLIFETDKLGVAGKVLGPYSSLEQRELWLEQNGYDRAFLVRYGSWVADAVRGDFGQSIKYKVPVGEVLWPRLANTGILALCVFALMIPLALLAGILAGMREGSALDRIVSFVAVATTSVPEFASATLLVALFVFELGWLPGTSSMTAGFDPLQLVLPVSVLVLFGFGYIARMTRASMTE
ncbi:MAG: ABC transporter permease, partial [Geminicoccaceae bacterium]|nr:ABC transporter permease [Geminicoccaceae bacterium]